MYKIALSEARVGMVLAETVMSADGKQMLLNSGQVLNRAMIQKLEERNVQLIVVADIYSLQINPIDQMHDTLMKTYMATIDKYSSPQQVGNKRDDIPKIVKNMCDIITEICKSEMILDYCIQMRMITEKNLFQKAVETSVFAGLLAGVYGCNTQDMYTIMVGGLLHDTGCLEMTFLVGKEKKTPQEELLWKEHPTYGYYFAIQNNLSREIAEIIQSHEERYDGSGFPHGLAGDKIPLGARIVAICANVTENIVYNHMKPYEAWEIIYGTSGIYFDAQLVKLFVSSVALYPMGALVRLSTGEVGVIVNIRKNLGARPVVKVFYNSFHKPLSSPQLVDLGAHRTVFVEEILG